MKFQTVALWFLCFSGGDHGEVYGKTLRRRLQVTVSQLQSNNNAGSCWVQVRDNAYDVTSYAPNHPPGASLITDRCGEDITGLYFASDLSAVHSDAVLAVAINKGVVVPNPTTTPTSPPGPSPTVPPAPSPTGAQPGPNPTAPPEESEESDGSDDYNMAPSPPPGSEVTQAEHASRNTAVSCWIQVNNNAYDVTDYAPNHPGGSAVIYAQCGLDATAIFYSINDHSTSDLLYAINMGTVVANEPTPAPGPTAAPDPTPAPTPLPTSTIGITMATVASHNNANDCWVKVNSNAYDVTAYAPGHPGGAGSIHAQCGKDITSIYFTSTRNTAPFHTNAALGAAINMGAVTDGGSSPPTLQPSLQTTLSPKPTLQTGELTMAMLASHSSSKSCWVMVNKLVYDVTAYAPTHPGGSATIYAQCGNDITSLYFAPNLAPFHTTAALGQAIELGEIVTDSNPTSAPTTDQPTTKPTLAPVAPTEPPTPHPSPRPTTAAPSIGTSERPSAVPSLWPSAGPIVVVSTSPTGLPSGSPSSAPSGGPSFAPSLMPSIVPSDRPSWVPSQYPSLLPSDMPSEDGICQDHPHIRFYTNSTNKTEPCVWLKARPEEQPEHCRPSHPSNAFWICQETCKSCEDSCEDDPDFEFVDDHGITGRDCLWLSLRPNKHEILCPTGNVSEGCKESCNNCPTLPPTSAPCDDILTETFSTPSDGNQTCTWLLASTSGTSGQQQEDLCSTNSEVQALCPESCGICTDYCDDSVNGTFPYNGSNYTCHWLASHPEAHDDVCYHFNDAWTLCKDTCNHWSCGINNTNTTRN